MPLPLSASLRGRNKFCGPAALAAILNCTTDEAAAQIRRVSGQRAVKGAYTFHVLDAIERLGGRCMTLPVRATLGDDRRLWQMAPKRPLTLAVVKMPGGGGHFVLVRKGKVLDSWTRKWVKVTEYVHRNTVVTEMTEIVKVPKLPKPPKRKRRKLTQAQKEYRAKRRKILDAAVHSMTIGPKVGEEFRMSEEGRWEDMGRPSEGTVVNALDRVGGYLVFNTLGELEDACWSISGGTLGIHMPAQCEQLMDRLFAAAREHGINPVSAKPAPDVKEAA